MGISDRRGFRVKSRWMERVTRRDRHETTASPIDWISAGEKGAIRIHSQYWLLNPSSESSRTVHLGLLNVL